MSGLTRLAGGLSLAALAACATSPAPSPYISGSYTEAEVQACRDLMLMPSLTIVYADVVERRLGVPAHCYVRGIVSGSISWHVQLPPPGRWTGRLVYQGDGGSDGSLDVKPDPYTRSWVSIGDAVVNSNSGHDSGAGPNWAYENRQAEIDFGYRAVHLAVNAARTLLAAYYGRAPDYSYHVGCSNGGRQGLMAAQRFPYDFDGIVAGAPSIFRAQNFYHHLKLMQQVYADDMAAAPAEDNDGNGVPDGLAMIEALHRAVLDRCDARDGIDDGVIDDPAACDFDLDGYLASHRCSTASGGTACITDAQAAFIRHLYSGSRDTEGKLVYGGVALGSEYTWDRFVPLERNDLVPHVLGSLLRVFQSIFDEDPGIVPVGAVVDRSQPAHDTGPLPEWAWWRQDPQAVLRDTAELERIIDATDPDLRRFLIDHGGKLLLYQGRDDPYHSGARLEQYFDDVIGTTFAGDGTAAASGVRLFMLPGVEHCLLGPGPDRWDRFQVIKDWVERDLAPGHIVVRHQTWDITDNERVVCPYPQHAHFTGPEGGENEPVNWIAANFSCGE